MNKLTVSFFFFLTLMTTAGLVQAKDFVYLNAENLKSSSDFYEQVEVLLELPNWQGKNLDALYDSLLDYSSEITLVIVCPQKLIEILGLDYYNKVLKVFSDAQNKGSLVHLSLIRSC